MTVYYQISNTTLISESGYDVQDIIFKMHTSTANLLNNGTVDCEYKCYKSKEDKDNRLSAYKLRVDGVRVKNISNYSLEPWGYEFGTQNYQAVETQMIADTFGVSLENITAHEDTPPAVEEEAPAAEE